MQPLLPVAIRNSAAPRSVDARNDRTASIPLATLERCLRKGATCLYA